MFNADEMTPLTPIQSAWIAGLIEGEGCIRLQVIDIRDWRTKRISKDRVTMSVAVAMKDSAVVVRLFELCGGHYHERSDGLCGLTMSSRRALWLLEQIQPFMVGDKKAQTDLAIEFQKRRRPGRRTHQEHAWELDAARRISEMKKVGIYERRKGPRAIRLEAALARQKESEISRTTSPSS